ncbi:hypothetical protein EXU30_19525 [Shewanella maritima]|uniref:Uncharacterized protein n=1 Tax=Shewanella maritima TaxID=2520507 RepID=A0A411PM64_9GAMM|nr:hypothetical protein [Shewanella maritima]QBF84616.1 hypothetical protein EXU30_19525 [Shewanella maritima]
MKQMNISLSYEQLAQLIGTGALCAADIRCLDSETKQAVWQMCLINCAKKIHCSNCTQPCGIAKSNQIEVREA